MASSPQVPIPAPSPVTLPLDNIQGDVILGLPKIKQIFVFFSVQDVPKFRKQLKAHVLPLITTTTDVQKDLRAVAANKPNGTLLPLSGVNLAFSHSGLVHLGITDDLGDAQFVDGQKADAGFLGDPGSGDPTTPSFDPTGWRPLFKGASGAIHGVFLFTGDSYETIDKQICKVQDVLCGAWQILDKICGQVRPGEEKGHEHFGFEDGVSQPNIVGAGIAPKPGQITIRPGVTLVGEDGDPNATSRPAWAKDGSFLVFRVLEQLVPEFHKFLLNNALPIPGFSKQQGADLLGARLIGRWKSGAPISLSPLTDDPALARDPLRNNNFNFSEDTTQTLCPFSAHIRKTNPRSDLTSRFGERSLTSHLINRAGIPFGIEVTDHERYTGATENERGLLFVCYQSVLADGFRFIQRSWANDPSFLTRQSGQSIGLDPIIGQENGKPLSAFGTNPNAPDTELTLPASFVVPRGGEYFFSPSISALRNTIGSD